MANVLDLHRAIAAVAPIEGISPDDWNDKATWRIDFAPEATAAEKAAARQVVDAFDVAHEVSSVPLSISDRQFFQQLAIEGIVTEAEALAAVKTGAIPPALQTLINAMPAAERFSAEMIVSGGTTFERAHPLTIGIGSAYGMAAADIDAFFIEAAAL